MHALPHNTPSELSGWGWALSCVLVVDRVDQRKSCRLRAVPVAQRQVRLAVHREP